MDLEWVMRWNDFRVDPISKGNPVRAIAARGDLKEPASPNGKRSAFGATDSKVYCRPSAVHMPPVGFPARFDANS